MNKSCARCTKVVYPIEELKCLDKTWHKTCFRCHECGMMLNMKTYKGFNKLPYCEAHIPKAKATAIADTPELKRIAENTKIQSNVQYHADFEKQKGKLTQVADDPETLRIKQNTKHISNVAYHGDLEKKAAMEKQREVAEVAENRDNESEYFSKTLAAESLYQQNSASSPTSISPLPSHSGTNIGGGGNSGAGNTHAYTATVSSNLVQQQHYAKPPPLHRQQHQMAAQYNAISGYIAPPHPQLETVNHSAPNNTYHSNSGVISQTYGGLVQQPHHPQQNINHIRHSVLQSAVNPSGATNQLHQPHEAAATHEHAQQLQQQQQQPFYYEKYDNYARPNAHSMPVAYSNNNIIGKHQSTGGGLHAKQNGAGAYNHHKHKMHQVEYNSIEPHTQLQYDNGSGSEPITGGSGGNGTGGGVIGKISDYDPLTDGPRNVPEAMRHSATLIYNSSDHASSTAAVSQQPRQIGSISEIDPANGIYGSVDQNNGYLQKQHQYQQQRQSHQQHSHQQHQKQQQYLQQSPATQHLPENTMQSMSNTVRIFRALYDYEAEDSDEVSFAEGDVIFEVESIDAGWMTGRVERTGRTGMLPANYVQPAIV